MEIIVWNIVDSSKKMQINATWRNVSKSPLKKIHLSSCGFKEFLTLENVWSKGRWQESINITGDFCHPEKKIHYFRTITQLWF